jgi:hypothetical protein
MIVNEKDALQAPLLIWRLDRSAHESCIADFEARRLGQQSNLPNSALAVDAGKFN